MLSSGPVTPLEPAMKARAFWYDRYICGAGPSSSKSIQPSATSDSCVPPARPRESPMVMRNWSGQSGGCRSRRVNSARDTWRQTKVRPVGRQTSLASSSTRDTSVGATSDSVTTATAIGGGADGVDAAAADETAIAAAARLVMISILPAIDGADRQKFDVRIREKRTLSNLEIDRHDVVRQRRAVLCNGHVTIVLLVGIERGAVGKGDHQRRVIGARRAHHVLSNLQIDDAVERLQGGQPLAVADTGCGVDRRFVLEAHDVDEHQSSSPSISSSATS